MAMYPWENTSLLLMLVTISLLLGCCDAKAVEVDLGVEPFAASTEHIHPTDDHDHGDMEDMTHAMPMYFHSSVHATIWFEGWHTMNWQELTGSCIGLAVIAALYEGFKMLRMWLLNKSRRSKHTSSHNQVADKGDSQMQVIENGCHNVNHANANSGGCNHSNSSPTFTESLTSCSHIGQALLHMVQVLLTMLLMLVFMTYNVYLCLAVLVGAGCGYYFFGWYNPTYSAQHADCGG